MKPRWNLGMRLLVACSVISLGAFNARAFSLLGPFEPWMEETNGLRQPGDIGGPMDISNEYRWNVPVVTYSFDQSFLDFFGSNGVAAVESAIQILNDLPPASQMVLTNYPLDTQQINYTAQAQNLYDLKSATLVALLEQLGLTQPTRYIYVVRLWNPIFINYGAQPWPEGTVPTNIVMRNYDPETLTPSQYVNGTLYSGCVFTSQLGGSPLPVGVEDIVSPIPVDPLAPIANAVADASINNLQLVIQSLDAGEFVTGLTEDDVGGLRYLLSTNNINYEMLLPGVVGTGANADSYVNGAWRPGVDKITFVHVAVDPVTGGFFSPFTNQYTDTYITNGGVMQQQLERVTTRPDFLFCAEDVNAGLPGVPLMDRTSTTNWINNAALNGKAGGAGPGMIQPPVKITFNRLGRQFISSGSDETAYDESEFYGSFDNSPNAPVVYPIVPSGSGQFTVRMWLTLGQYPNQFRHSFDWETNTSPGAVFAMETSTSLTNWTTLFTITNDGSVCTYLDFPTSTARFYRFVPQ